MTKLSLPVQQDPVVQQLLSNASSELANSFSEEQLLYLRNTMATKHWRRHSLDLRGNFKWFRYRYYYVIVAGRDRRSVDRQGAKVSHLVSAMVLTSLLLVAVLLGLAVLYIFKSALGIDLFASISLGLWDWLKSH